MSRKLSSIFVFLMIPILLTFCQSSASFEYVKVQQSAFTFKKGEVVAILGNGLPDSMQHDAWMETLLQAGSKGLNLSFRNMSLSGDTVFSRPRNSGFPKHDFYLNHVKADVIFLFFGYNESFAGEAGLETFKQAYAKLIDSLGQRRFVLFSPIAHENLNNPSMPDGSANNARLALYSKAISEVAKDKNAAYVDLFSTSSQLYASSKEALTLNGILPLAEGNKQFAEVIALQLLGKKVTAVKNLEKLRKDVLDKSWHWFNRYRATDGNDVWGGRSKLSFVDGQNNRTVLMHELKMIDVMTANRDKKIWFTLEGKNFKVHDSNVPAPIKVKSNVGGKSRSSNKGKEGDLSFVTAKQTLEGFKMPKGYEAKVFATEEMFPEMVNPVILNVGPKGRLWAACWTTYPKWEPLKEMNDRIVILTDSNKDGVADKLTTFAKVHNPTGFTFWNGGVIVASQPRILFLKDTDGDDVADVQITLLQGIDSADTHHAASHLVVGQDGGLYFQSGVFFVNNVETPWRKNYLDKSSSIYRLDLNTYEFWKHAPNNPNPHGISFDYWGNHFITDGTGGRGYQVVPNKKGFKSRTFYKKKVRPVPSHGIISSEQFPDDVQGNFLICNSIGFLGMKQYKPTMNTDTGEVSTVELEDMLVSTRDRNFRPTDVKFGSDGAMYVSDWSNMIIGHMQHNIRDPNRDHVHGRIFRITYKGRPLQKNVKIHGESLPKLLKLLEHKINGVRERARAEISSHPTAEVIAATEKWMKKFNAKKEGDAHHLMEALWIYQRRNVINRPLLKQLLNGPNLNARVAARTVDHYWSGKAGKTVKVKKVIVKYVRPAGLDKSISDKEYKLGKAIYHRDAHCYTCHMANGEGIPKIYPPLAKSEWVTGDKSSIIKILLNGMTGPITVAGKKYGIPGLPPMTPFRDLLDKDEEMAAVLNYVRNSFGNKAKRITAKEVAVVRKKLKGNTDFMTEEFLKKK
jgi:mono/diheme cytochrome c family protein